MVAMVRRGWGRVIRLSALSRCTSKVLHWLVDVLFLDRMSAAIKNPAECDTIYDFLQLKLSLRKVWSEKTPLWFMSKKAEPDWARPFKSG